jgi:thioesterase domain-containing protein
MQVDARPGRVLEVAAQGSIDERAVADAPVMGLHLSGRRAPLVLVRTWGSELEGHRNLARHLGPDQPIYSVAPPQGERVEDFPATTDEWADFCLRGIEALPVAGPRLIGGFSFGGVLALEVARKLDAGGEKVALVALIDSRVPKRHERPRGRHRRTWLQKIARRLTQFAALRNGRERLGFVRWRLRRRRTKLGRKLEHLWQRRSGGRRRRAAPGEGAGVVAFNGKQLTLLQRAIWVSYLKYEPERCGLRVAQFWTNESRAKAGGDATLGWTQHLDGPLTCDPIPGTHFGVFDDPHAPVLAARLARVLRSACEEF